MTGYLDCWISVATAILSQALAGGPELKELLSKPIAGETFGFEWSLAGDEEGRFSMQIDATVLEARLLGEGDQKPAWSELLREVAEAAAGELLAKTGRKCRVATWAEASSVDRISHVFEIRSDSNSWTLFVHDETHVRSLASGPTRPGSDECANDRESTSLTGPGLELLLDVELEAALRFGCREMLLGEILDLGAGDVVELDRHVTDPVDLIVGDRIVARGEVVLVNGNFGLRVSEVATPRRRLESIRCLF